MAVVASDVVVYGSTIMPTGDTEQPGGAINTAIKMTFTDMAHTTGIVMSSNGLSDSCQISATGRNAGGSIVTDTFLIHETLARVTGDSAVAFERVLRLGVSSGSHTGIITITEDDGPTFTAIGTMENGVDNIYRPFYNVSSAADNAKEYFEKVFIKNNNAVNNLLSAQISESGEVGFTDKITFDLANVQNDDHSAPNRLSPPSGADLLSGTTGDWDDSAKNVPGTDLNSGSGIGVWLKLDLAAGTAADAGQYVIQIDGSTTA